MSIEVGYGRSISIEQACDLLESWGHVRVAEIELSREVDQDDNHYRYRDAPCTYCGRKIEGHKRGKVPEHTDAAKDVTCPRCLVYLIQSHVGHEDVDHGLVRCPSCFLLFAAFLSVDVDVGDVDFEEDEPFVWWTTVQGCREWIEELGQEELSLLKEALGFDSR